MASHGATVLYRYRFGDVELDESGPQVRVAGRAVDLEPRPFALLLELLRHAGEVVTRQALIESVWAGRPTVYNVVPNAMAKLRRALGGQRSGAIVTVPRVGYRLDAPVLRMVVESGRIAGMALSAGQSVPLRPRFRLERRLGGAAGRELWLARREGGGTARVFAFAPDRRRRAMIEQEAALWRALRQRLGARAEAARAVAWHVDQPPFYLDAERRGRLPGRRARAVDHAEVDTGPAPGPTPTDRLGLLVQIAEAVLVVDAGDGLGADARAGLQLALAHAYRTIGDAVSSERQHLRGVLAGPPGDTPAALQAELGRARVLAARTWLDDAARRLQHALAQAMAGAPDRRADAEAMYAHWARASWLMLSRRLGAADAAYRRALAAQARLRPERLQTRIQLLVELADARSCGGRTGEALQVLRELLGPDYAAQLRAADRANVQLLLGRCLVAERRFAEAEPILSKVVPVLRGLHGAGSHQVDLAHCELAPLYWLSGRSALAVRHARTAHRGLLAHFGPAHQVVLIAQQVLATALFFDGRLAEAIDHYALAHAGLAGLLGGQAPMLMGIGYRWAFALAEAGRYAEARRVLAGVDGPALDAATGEALWAPRVDALRALILVRQERMADALRVLAASARRLEAGAEPERYLRSIRDALDHDRRPRS